VEITLALRAVPEYRPRTFFALGLVLAMLASLLSHVQAAVNTAAATAGVPAAHTTAEAALSKMPLPFVANAGQAQGEVSFTVNGSETSLGFLRRGVSWRLSDGSNAYVLRQAFVGGQAVTPVGIDPQRTRFSWFKGDPSEWVAGARAYSAVRYEDVWPGIDVVYSGNASKVEYRFVVSPGADPSQIRMAYRGADTTLTASGELRVATPVRTFTDQAPHASQDSAAVPSSYMLHDGTYSFDVGEYDRSRTLVVDPTVPIYAGFVGGSGTDYGQSIAVDSSGAAYVVGYSDSTETSFPVSVGPDSTYNGGANDAFVAKVAPSGDSLVYAGYIGGWLADLGPVTQPHLSVHPL